MLLFIKWACPDSKAGLRLGPWGRRWSWLSGRIVVIAILSLNVGFDIAFFLGQVNSTIGIRR